MKPRIALLVGALLLMLAPAVHAAGTVKLKLVAIRASKGPGGIDPSLKRISKDLQRAFGGYTRFERLDKTELTLTQGKAAAYTLPNRQKAEFTYTGQSGKKHSIKLSIPSSKVSVALRAPFRKMFYQAGIKQGDGILILGLYLKP